MLWDKLIKLQFHKDSGPIVIRQSTYLTYIAPHIQTFSLLFKEINLNFFLIHSFKLFCLFFIWLPSLKANESLIKTEPERFHTGLSSSLHYVRKRLNYYGAIISPTCSDLSRWFQGADWTETYCCKYSARATVRDSSEFLRRKHDGGSEPLILRLF